MRCYTRHLSTTWYTQEVLCVNMDVKSNSVTSSCLAGYTVGPQEMPPGAWWALCLHLQTQGSYTLRKESKLAHVTSRKNLFSQLY